MQIKFKTTTNQNLLDMTNSLHDYNDSVMNSTKVHSVDFPFIPQNEDKDDDTVGDITDNADEIDDN